MRKFTRGIFIYYLLLMGYFNYYKTYMDKNLRDYDKELRNY